jgi:hypothetical protein
MNTVVKAAILASGITLQIGAARGQECATFVSGEVLCDDGFYAYYWSPATQQWRVLDRDATAAALGLETGESSTTSEGTGGTAIYGSDGSLTTTDDGCMMLSSPGYTYGESLSFSSGC